MHVIRSCRDARGRSCDHRRRVLPVPAT